jgi:hypothetical protein
MDEVGTLRPLYHQRKGLQYALDMGLCGLHSRFRRGEGKRKCHLAGVRHMRTTLKKFNDGDIPTQFMSCQHGNKFPQGISRSI